MGLKSYKSNNINQTKEAVYTYTYIMYIHICVYLCITVIIKEKRSWIREEVIWESLEEEEGKRNNVNTVYVCIKKLEEFNRDMF